MAEEFYTPTTGRVLDAYIWCDMGSTSDEWDAARTAEFGRWLAGVKADAWDEGYKDCFLSIDGSGWRELEDNPYRKGGRL